MPTEERVPFDPSRFLSRGARKVLGTTAELAIDVDNEKYSKEVILKCNTIAMLRKIRRLRATIQQLQERIHTLEELHEQETGVCCVCRSAVAVRILQNCGCRVLCSSDECYTMIKFRRPRIRNCPYCRAERIRRDISAPLHLWFWHCPFWMIVLQPVSYFKIILHLIWM
jgi:hypothetical protein